MAAPVVGVRNCGAMGKIVQGTDSGSAEHVGEFSS